MINFAFLKKAIPIASLAVDLVQKAWGVINGIFHDISQVTDQTKPEDIAEVGENLSELRMQMLAGIAPVLAKVQAEIDGYIDEVHVWLETKGGVLCEKPAVLRPSYRALDNAKREATLFWEDRMSRKISFDDADCNRILRMPRGARRDAAMVAFVQGALVETAEAYGEAFKASMDQFADDLLADIDEVKAALDEQVADMKKVYEAQQQENPEELAAALLAAQKQEVRYEALLGFIEKE